MNPVNSAGALPDLPDFHDPAFLRQHLLDTMAFYDGRCIDPSGGLYQVWHDDGSVLDPNTRHLVGSTRYVVTHALMVRLFPRHPKAPSWRTGMRHALAFVQQAHFDPARSTYAWELQWRDGRAEVTDATQHCYGLAFVLLAHASALQAGMAEARAGLDGTFEQMEQRFWDGTAGLYADEATPDGVLSAYRGQNANMHACEAMLAAFEATGEARFLARAEAIARAVTQRLAAHGHGLVWEHWAHRTEEGAGWTPDWQFHRDQPGDLFRPWGYQTGHQTEWVKLLLTLERLSACAADFHSDTAWMLPRARALFDAAVQHGWDAAHGGLVYGFAPAGEPWEAGPMRVCDGGKYHWVQAESLAAAAALGARTGDAAYWTWYDRLWAYAWQHFVDHQHGAWFRVLAADNARITEVKSPPSKVDYHTLGAVAEALRACGARAAHPG